MITLTLDDKEQQVLASLLDTATKALGLQAAEAALHFVRKMAEAKAAADKKDPPHLVGDMDDKAA